MDSSKKYYIVNKTFKADCLYHWNSPYSTGDDVFLPEGLIFEIDISSASSATSVYASPLPYADWERILVPWHIRISMGYAGFSLIIRVDRIENYCSVRDDNSTPDYGNLLVQRAIQGCLLGTAVGDAIGLPYEGLPPRPVNKLFPLKHRFLFNRGMVSDDTEHACMTAQALIGSAGDPDLFGRKLAGNLKWWLLGFPAGIGYATLKSLVKLWSGVSYEKSGVFSAGNGPAMRCAIIGIYAGDNIELLRKLVKVSTRITHSDPKAEKGALILARTSAISASGKIVEPHEYLEAIEPFFDNDKELEDIVTQAVESARAGESARQFCNFLKLEKGVSGYMYHTLPVVLQIWIRFQRDYKNAVEEAVSCGGDTDTVAAILGGITGAGTGIMGIPSPWLNNLMEWPRSKKWMELLSWELTGVKLMNRKRMEPDVLIAGLLLRNIFFMIVVLLHGFRRMFFFWS